MTALPALIESLRAQLNRVEAHAADIEQQHVAQIDGLKAALVDWRARCLDAERVAEVHRDRAEQAVRAVVAIQWRTMITAIAMGDTYRGNFQCDVYTRCLAAHPCAVEIVDG